MSASHPSDPLEILIAHNHWATRLVLDACRGLSKDQFHQSFDIGPGSLHDTVRHIIGAMWGWTDVLAGREIRDRPEEGEEMTVDELAAMLDDAHEDLVKHASGHPLDESITRERGGREYTFTRGAILTHVTTHGMHHRAQCVNMLRQLGVDDPNPSVLWWMITGG